MKAKDLRTKKIDDLLKMKVEKEKELRDFVYGASGSKSKNTKLGKTIKKDIARILTITKELAVSNNK
jgi:ribosomal protein L29